MCMYEQNTIYSPFRDVNEDKLKLRSIIINLKYWGQKGVFIVTKHRTSKIKKFPANMHLVRQLIVKPPNSY